MTYDKYIFYHGNCADGKLAAAVAYLRFNDLASYQSIAYKDNPPDIRELRGKEVYILDFSFPLEYMQSLCAVAKSVVLIDHHISAINALESLLVNPPRNLTAVCDITNSGCMLAWRYFNGSMLTPPQALTLVEDYDLWTHDYPESNYLVAYLHAAQLTISQAAVFILSNVALTDGIASGRLLNSVDNVHAKKALHGGYVCQLVEMTCLAVNVPSYLSNKVGELAKVTKKPYPTVCYTDTKSGCGLSIRTGYSEVDVSVLADKIGQIHGTRGGGHKAAAGVHIPKHFITLREDI